MKAIIRQISFNLKAIFLFELVYRIIGILFILPIMNGLLQLSFLLTDNSYISNSEFVDYITDPVTIMLLFFLLLVIGLYLSIEAIFLSVIFQFSFFQEKIVLRQVLNLGLDKTIHVLKKYHIMIVIPGILFFILIESISLTGLYSSYALPPVLLEQITTNQSWIILLLVFILVVMICFIESMFIIHITTFHSMKISQLIIDIRALLSRKRLRLLLELIAITLVANIILYILFMTTVGLLSVILSATYSTQATLSILLTLLYILNLVFFFIVSIVLVPFLFSWSNNWYHKQKYLANISFEIMTEPYKKPYKKRNISTLLLVSTLVIIIVINIFNTYQFIDQTLHHIQLFNYPEVIAHRGDTINSPENTLASIKEGLHNQADSIEFDVRLTKDGIPVLMHDETLARTTGGVSSSKVADLTYEELLEYDVGSWFSDIYIGEHIPTLEEALTLIGNKADVYLEIKGSTRGIEQAIIDVINELNMENHIKIMSFNSQVLKNIKTIDSSLQTVFLLNSFYGDLTVLLENENIDEFAFENSFIIQNTDLINQIKQANRNIYIWTVDDSIAIENLTRLGVDGIITNVPLESRIIIYKRTTRAIYYDLLEKIYQ